MADGAVRTGADALRLDWARDLRWAVRGDPWTAALGSARARDLGPAAPESALPGLTRARTQLRLDSGGWPPDGPLVVGFLEDAPLCGTLANLYAAAGAIALGREMRAALGRPVPVALVLVGGPDARPHPLYVLGREGEVRRVAVARQALGAQEARRGAVALLGSLEEVAGRPWPEARETLEAAATLDRAGGEDLWASWTVRLWRRIAGPSGAAVLHWALPPLRQPLTDLTASLRLARTALGPAVRSAAQRLDEAGIATPEGPDAVFETWRCGDRGCRPAAEQDGAPERWARAVGPPKPQEQLRPARGGALLLCHALLRPSVAVAGDDDVARLLMSSLAIQRLDGDAPAVRPRPRFTMVAPAESAFARAHNAPLDQGPAALRLARDRALARAAGGRLHDELEALRSAVNERLERLGAEVESSVPRAAELARSRSDRLRAGVDLLIAEVCGRRRSDDRVRARAWRHLLSALYPFGGHQDEWLAAYPWAACGGGALLERVCREVPGPGRRWLRWPESAGRPVGRVAASAVEVAAARAPDAAATVAGAELRRPS